MSWLLTATFINSGLQLLSLCLYRGQCRGRRGGMQINSNKSSGSSVDSDHVPTKRLCSSTIITRRSKTIAPKRTIVESDTRLDSPFPTNDYPSSLSKPNTETDTVSGIGAESEPKPETPGADMNMSSFGAHINQTNGTAANIAPTPRCRVCGGC